MNSLFFKVLLLFLTVACSNSLTQKPKETETEKMHRIVDHYFQTYLKLNPLFASEIGDHAYDNQLTIPISKTERKKAKALVRNSLHEIQFINSQKLSYEDQLTLAMFISDLQAKQKLMELDLSYLCPFNQFDSFFSTFAELASGNSFVTFNSQKDYENFLQRAAVVPKYFDVMIENMKEGIKKGVTTPKVLVEEGLKQLDALLVPDYQKSLFYQSVLTMPQKVSGEALAPLKAQYDKMVQKTLYPAYQKLRTFIQTEYLPHARTTAGLISIPGGELYYQALLHDYTTTDLSPDKIMQLGLKEVKRIEETFETIKNEIGFTGDLQAFYAFLQEKKEQFFPFHSEHEVIEAYKNIEKIVLHKMPLYFHKEPNVALEIRAIPAFKAAKATEMYEAPAKDGSRPGVFWIPILQPENYPNNSMQAMFLHEVIPGHHYQISLQQQIPNLPAYRQFMGNTAYIEGWALYAESLGKDLGLYTEIYQWIGRLTLEIHRAVRLVVDTGLHWKGWTRQEAIEYSLQHEPFNETAIATSIDRYMALPAQAVTYKIGELKIQELKTKAKEMLGSSFSEANFHNQVLDGGALPLSVLDAKVMRWINEESSLSH